MPRGRTLAQLRSMLRAEIGQTMNTSAASQNDDNLNQLLASKQSFFASEYDWPFLEQRWDLAVAAGTRYIALPGSPNTPGTANLGINFDRPVRADVYFNSKWLCLDVGIGIDEYNNRNSDLNEQLDPIQRWRMASNVTDTSADRIEVWPIPVTACTIRFTGQRVLKTLFTYGDAAGTNDALTADLDDYLLVYTVAGEILLPTSPEIAKVKAQQAFERLTKLRADAAQTNNGKIILGGGNQQQKPRTASLIITA